MNSGIEKLFIARDLINNALSNSILKFEFLLERFELRFMFSSSIRLFIRYNDFNKYGYQIVFTKKSFDRIRFDNFDDKWDVKTRPHHFHQRGAATAFESDMIGDPVHDIPILIKKLLKFELE